MNASASRRARRLLIAWPHARAAFVALHCAAVAIVAMPAPSRSSRVIAMDDPRFAAEVHPWATLLGMSDEAFARRAEDVRSRWADARARIVSPFERYLALVGALQPWSLFSAPNRSPARFEVDTQPVAAADGDRGWSFLSGVPPGDWRPSFFGSERVRSYVNTVGRTAGWTDADKLCFYVSRVAWAERGEGFRVRCRFVSVPSPSWRTQAPPIPERHVVYSRVVDPQP